MAELNVPSGNTETAAGDPPDIPGHKLLRRIGRGSYGEVWLARTSEGEYRAVKIVYRHTFERERPFEREFSGIQKFEPVSRTNPSQVSILQVGRDNEAGFFYYVMELADDESSPSGREINPATYKPKTLRSEVAASGRIPYDRALDISLSLTKALEHLHQHGLIHRDIKPSNIIFVKGVPKLADIGLVTDVGASISYVGTEGFLPPEGPVSQQADLYSLGKVLYEMSTGQDRMDFPELPTFLGEPEEKQGLLELNLVFLKACQNEPQRRYGTAQEMGADLAILRSGKSLKKTRALERRLANITRAFGLTAAAGLIAALGYYAWNQHRLKRLEEEVARRERDKQIAQDAARSTERQLVDLYLAVGEGFRKEGDLGGALAWYARAFSEDTDPSRIEEHRQRIIAPMRTLPKLVGFIASPTPVNETFFSRDHNRLVTSGEDQCVRIWDAVTGLSVGKPLRHKSGVLYAELSADGQRVLAICKDGSAWLWRLADDEIVAFEMGDRVVVRAGSFSPNGRFVLTRGENNRVIVWDGFSARERLKLEHHTVPAAASYSPDGRYAGVIAGQKLYIWDAERGEKLAETVCQHEKPERLVFSADSRKVLVPAGNAAQVCNVANGEWSIFSLQESGAITCAEFTPDGRAIITGTTAGVLRAWDTVAGEARGNPWRFQKGLTGLAVSPDGSAVVCASDDQAWIVEIKSGEVMSLPASHRGGIRRVAFSKDGRLVLTAAADGALRVSEMLSDPIKTGASQLDLPVDELPVLVRLITGRQAHENERLVAVEPATLLSDWQHLKTNAIFTATRPAQWHLARAERLHGDGAWFGVRFHAERLGKLGASDKRISEWEANAMEGLARLDVPVAAAQMIPQRSPEATADLIDLTRFYNASLTGSWLPTNYVGRSNDLSQLPAGVQKFNGVMFDVRGLIQLSGTALENLGGNFPKQISAIPIDRKATYLHFLQGAAWDSLYGTTIGKYVVRYEGGESREVKIVFGRNVRDWWFPPTQPQMTMEAAVAWQGYSPASRHMGMALRIYQFKWKNPLPELKVQSIDFVSAMEKPAPFLLAITTEPEKEKVD